MIDYFVQDLMLAIRSARRRPMFTAVLLAVLTLGIGLTTAIFSVFYGVLLRPLAFEDPSVAHFHASNVGAASCRITTTASK